MEELLAPFFAALLEIIFELALACVAELFAGVLFESFRNFFGLKTGRTVLSALGFGRRLNPDPADSDASAGNKPQSKPGEQPFRERFVVFIGYSTWSLIVVTMITAVRYYL